MNILRSSSRRAMSKGAEFRGLARDGPRDALGLNPYSSQRRASAKAVSIPRHSSNCTSLLYGRLIRIANCPQTARGDAAPPLTPLLPER
jgi:hypothetical protein